MLKILFYAKGDKRKKNFQWIKASRSFYRKGIAQSTYSRKANLCKFCDALWSFSSSSHVVRKLFGHCLWLLQGFPSGCAIKIDHLSSTLIARFFLIIIYRKNSVLIFVVHGMDAQILVTLASMYGRKKFCLTSNLAASWRWTESESCECGARALNTHSHVMAITNESEK